MASQEDIEGFINTLDLLSIEIEPNLQSSPSSINTNEEQERQQTQRAAETIIYSWLDTVTTTEQASKLGRLIGRELFTHTSRTDEAWMPKTIATWLEKMEQEIAYQILKMMLPDVRERWNEAELALMEKKLVIQAFAVSTRVAVTQMIMADQVKEAADLRAKAM